MRHDSYAWVTLVGKVFVPADEVQELLAKGTATILSKDDVKIETEQEAFDFLAQEKIGELFPTETPMKLQDIIVDLSTYKS